MSRKEVSRVPVLENACKKLISNSAGAKTIGVTVRQFRRLKHRYKQFGVEGIIHQSRGKTSNNVVAESTKSLVIELIREKYFDFGPTLAREKLAENHNLFLSVETLRKEMIRVGIWKAKHRTRADIHQLRERRAQEGELVQGDGSPHAWFEDRAPECCLLVFIDDATGKLLWLEFCESESTQAYLLAVNHYLLLHGRPLAFYTDKHSVFRVNTSKLDSASVTDNNGITQFSRAMGELDITMIFANSPQAKGRVERVNETLQDRLVKELRLLNISNIADGNNYLPKYIEIFNAKFAVTPASSINAHRPLLASQKLEEILCLKSTRVLTKNLTAQYQNTTYQIQIEPKFEYTLRRAKIEVIETLAGQITLNYKNKPLTYSVINERPKAAVCDSKIVNKMVESVKEKQGRNYQFNLLGRTFLLWTKADISTLR